ncbi:hypothetical protein BDFB_014485 [Asbolus verrucosus]|uniref:Mutator-like transposase domain-containing protein n=1 Tax=Asbolus verrucosus TaxID=1661398 RepID=A0A482VBN0_ASBVE|nr:hypothetical protein BDFB_014485 [Asbolus verrucosus]
MDINKSAVCGTLAIGAGYSQFSELCSSLDIPTMSSRTFVNKEKSISETKRENVFSGMIQVGQQEIVLAVEAGDIDVDSVPQIAVIVDGAWSKRSYKSN